MPNKRMTVFERAALTGANAGPGNKMVARMAAAARAPVRDVAAGISELDDPNTVKAPNYRNAEGNSLASCAGCANFDALTRNCSKYGFTANPTKVCDGFDEPQTPDQLPSAAGALAPPPGPLQAPPYK